MADNVVLLPGGGGDTVAADEIGAAKYQRIKLTLGADGVNDLDVASGNPIPAKESRPASSAVTSVTAAAASTVILASTAARKAAYFYNDSAFALYLKCGATASTTSFSKKLEGGEFFALPHPAYTGAIDGIWDGAVGAVRITELT